MFRGGLGLASLLFGLGYAATGAQGQTAEEILQDFTNIDLWKGRVSLGFDYSPSYAGSEDYEFTIRPGIDALWNDLIFFRTIGGVFQKQGDGVQVGGTFLPTTRLRLNTGIQIRRGRSDSDDLTGGAGELDSSWEVFLAAEYAWDYFRIDGSINQGVNLFTDGHGGTLIKGGLSLGARFRPELDGWARVGASWGSEDYTDFFYGVPSRYVNEGGLQDLSLGSGAVYRITEKISVDGSADYRILISSSDSPIVDTGSRHVLSFGANLRYDF